MRILFVVNEVPFPPDNGTRIVSYNAMRMMREAGHELALAVLTEEADNPELRFSHAAAMCQRDMAWWMALPRRSRIAVQSQAVLNNHPFFVERYRSALFRQRLVGLIETFRPDAIHFGSITMAQYLSVAPADAGTIASVKDSHALALKNALASASYAGLERAYRTVQFKQVCNYESELYPRFDAVHLMSEVDAAYLKGLNLLIETVVIPNGVNEALFGISGLTCGQTDVIFVAKLARDNVAALRKFLECSWPIVQAKYRDVRLHVVGEVGVEAQAIRVLYGHLPSVLFRGYVEELAGAYKTCGIAIAPIDKDGGIINKAIEAMAAGLAVVGFAKTFAGIKEAKPDQHCVTANDYVGLGRAIVELIRNESRRKDIQIAAHQMARKCYSWSTRTVDYERMYGLASERARSKLAASLANKQ